MRLSTRVPLTFLLVLSALGLCSLGAPGCSTSLVLTSGGEGVRQLSSGDLTTGCNLLGEVVIGMSPDASRPDTEEELIILMRNRTADMGGRFVRVDSANPRTENGASYYVGRGVAFACPEGFDPSGGSSGGGSGSWAGDAVTESSGGEVGEDGAGGGDGEGEEPLDD